MITVLYWVVVVVGAFTVSKWIVKGVEILDRPRKKVRR